MNAEHIPVVLTDQNGTIEWRGWLAGFLADNDGLNADEVERYMAAFEPYLIGGGAAPAFTLMRERYIVEVRRGEKWVPVFTQNAPFGYVSRSAAYRAVRERADDGIAARVVTRPSNL